MTNAKIGGEIVAKYLEALSGDFESRPSDRGVFLVTPFIRPDGEAIELEMEELANGRVVLSDMGDTLGYLFVNGLNLNQPAMDSAKLTAMAHGVRLEESEFSIEADVTEMGGALHRLIHAVLAVTYLIQGTAKAPP